MSDGTNPTAEQKHWFARVFGPDLWSELCRKPEFLRALDQSLGKAREVALRHLADKEISQGLHG